MRDDNGDAGPGAGMPGAGPRALSDEPLSLLWPPATRGRYDRGRLGQEAVDDLEIERIVLALSGGERLRQDFVRSVLTTLCPDPAVIEYRVEALTDLVEDEGLRTRLQAALPGLTALLEAVEPRPGDGVVHQVVKRLWELAHYTEVVVQLREALAVAPPRSVALRTVAAHVEAVAGSAAFTELQAELPALRAAIERPGSVVIGINLGTDLSPESAAILSLSEAKVAGRGSFVDRVLGAADTSGSLDEVKSTLAMHVVGGRQDNPPIQPTRGITPLRVVQANPPTRGLTQLAGVQAAPSGRDTPLARDLRALLEHVAEPVRRELNRYLGVHTHALRAIEPELSFLLQCANLIVRLREAGLPMCRPECAPANERSATLRDGYNVVLALRMLRDAVRQAVAGELVLNPVDFDEHARVWILTGPNRGGKTVYACSVGQAQVLFQAGLYVPARSARLSPVDAIFTHFPTPERAQPGMGRLDEEAARLSAIFGQAGPDSLILLNEVLAGTNGIEGLAMAHDVVRGLRLLGGRAIYVTHLHELAGQADEINAHTAGDARVGSLVSEVEVDGAGKERRTFRIRPGVPVSSSYASVIAEQHGISFPQLAALFAERGLLPPADDGATSVAGPSLRPEAR
jgi:DNA mismatch repair protein MutS